MIFIVILAGIRLTIWVDFLNYTDRSRILYSIYWWQIEGVLSTRTCGFGPKNHVKPHIVIEILANTRLRIWVDLLNYTDRRTILRSLDWSQMQGGLWTKNSGFRGKKPYKIHDFHSNPCRHSLDNLGWPSNCLDSMQNFVLYRLVTDSKGPVDQKRGVWVEKPYKIHDFHSNLCRHSLGNLASLSKLHQSTHNFMLYRFVTDTSGVVGQKLGFALNNHITYIIFKVILADTRLRISVDLLNYTDRRTILCSIDWWQIQGGLYIKNWSLSWKTI